MCNWVKFNSWVQCSEGLTNRVYNIIITFFHILMVTFYMMYMVVFCMLLFNCVNYVFVIIFMYYCYICNIVCILFHCVVLCTVYV
jgi:hypothetical protein